MYTLKPFGDMFNYFVEPQNFGEGIRNPNIINNKEEYVVEISVPGLTKDDIDIKVKDSIITFSHKKEETNDESFYFTSSFSKSYSLPDDVNDKKITAKVENGILRTIIPKDKKKLAEYVIEIQ